MGKNGRKTRLCSHGHVSLSDLGRNVHQALHSYFVDRKNGTTSLSDREIANQNRLVERTVRDWRKKFNKKQLIWVEKFLVASDNKLGRAKALSNGMENNLVDWIKMMCRNHCPPSRDALVLKASLMLLNEGSDKSYLSLTWARGFEKRHPNITFVAPNEVETKYFIRPALEHVKNFFNNIKKCYDDAQAIGNDVVFVNMDETGVEYLRGRFKVYSLRDIPGSNKRANPDKTTSEHCTFLGCVATNDVLSDQLPLFYLFSSKIHDGIDFEPHAKGTKYLKRCQKIKTDCGWMNENIFVQWVQELIKAVENFRKEESKKTVVLLIDYSSTHLSEESFKLLKDAEIGCLFVPPRGTPEYQPLDVGIYQHVKQTLRIGMKRNGPENSESSKLAWADVIKVFGASWEENSGPAKIKNAFSMCGISPLVIPHQLVARTSQDSTLRNNYHLGDIVRNYRENKFNIMQALTTDSHFMELLALVWDVNKKSMFPFVDSTLKQLVPLEETVQVALYDEISGNPFATITPGVMPKVPPPKKVNNKRKNLQNVLMSNDATSNDTIHYLEAEREREEEENARKRQRKLEQEKIMEEKAKRIEELNKERKPVLDALRKHDIVDAKRVTSVKFNHLRALAQCIHPVLVGKSTEDYWRGLLKKLKEPASSDECDSTL